MEKHHRVKQATDDCVACTMHAGPKVTNTHSEYVILITFPLQQLLHECTSMLHYTYCACLVEFVKNVQVFYYLLCLKAFVYFKGTENAIYTYIYVCVCVCVYIYKTIYVSQYFENCLLLLF